ncbi:hypothetical protein, partial [Vibrio vulnificus]|uniref:hypothetical protein n=1 Tax=Vibrio vulnificus TaxID=672 RepID=UPI00057C50F1
SIDSGSKEVLLSLAPVAYDLGLDLTMIAEQVGGSFYGGEAQRFIRDGEELKGMVRYPTGFHNQQLQGDFLQNAS